MAGQFEWLMSYRACSSNTANYDCDGVNSKVKTMVYGCNLLLRKQRPTLPNGIDNEQYLTDTFTLLATPLKRNVHLSSEMEEFNALADGGFLAWTQPSLYSTTPLKVPQIVQAVESAVSPSLTIISDRSCSIGCSSSRTGSFSIPRIEDSLEELDKLEDELEAVGEVTRARRINLAEGRIPTAIPDTIPELRTSKSMKRASMMCMSATVRAKSSESTKPALRRSASLTLRGQRHDAVDMAPLQNMDGMSSRVKFGGTHQTSSNMSTRSAKPPTIARFELPGDAVARRLKEQRETRQAQQAEVQKAGASPPKVKSNRLLAKPSFELPGEAISRRKREERETKLREQEEEERKRREFKARPVRYNTAQNSISRDTITSRIRLTKTQEENAEKKNSEAMKSKRMSIGTSRSGSAITPAAKAPSVRGRNPIIIQGDDMSRGTSASASSSSGKGSSVCVEIAAQQRVRSHQIYTRDNSSYTLHREREKREREATAKAAREQAAERSRIASREWAEKQRRKEAMQQQRRSIIHQA